MSAIRILALGYPPEWLAGIRGGGSRMKAPEIGLGDHSIAFWIYRHSTNNLWRVAGWYDLEDLVNDGMVIALKCRERLGRDVDVKLYNSYVRRAFHNHIGELIRKKRSLDEVCFLDLADSDQSVSGRPEPQSQEMVTLLRQMPEGLKRVLYVMLSKEGQRKLDEPMRQRVDGCETMADRLFRLAGWRRDLDFEEEFTEYLLHG